MSSMGDDAFLSQFQLLHTKIIAYTMKTLAEMRVDHCTKVSACTRTFKGSVDKRHLTLSKGHNVITRLFFKA